MGGRGSSSGVSNKGRKYGSEFTTLYQSGNIKFVRYNDSKSAKTPQETMTSGRVYVTVNNRNEPKAITYYDKENKRYKQVDIDHDHNDIKGPHAHWGFNHSENGTTRPSTEEKIMVDRVRKLWYNFLNSK